MTVEELRFERRELLMGVLAAGAGSVLGPVAARAGDPAPPMAATAAPPASTPPPSPDVAGPGVPLGRPVPFSSGTTTDLARALSKKPFKPLAADLPDPFKNLSADQYASIHARREGWLWTSDMVGFAIEPLHRGFLFSNPVELNVVFQGQAYRLVYDSKLFDFGKAGQPGEIGDIGFSGFRVLTAPDKIAFSEIATFQGANFFRALTRDQVPGLVSRALAVRLADPKGEDVPVFRAMWIEKPSLVANALIVHAVIDSETMTGAFRFTIRPGEATIIDTECTLFPRVNIDNFGIGAMSATHLLGFMDHGKFDDLRPNVNEVTGLQMYTGAGEWLWRPVTNRDTLQISTFVDDKPRGFGLLMRDRAFDDYDDEDQHWERRPSLWIEPLGEWGPGGVQLIEIPSESEANDNILCFWRPRQALAAGSEMPFAYRQFWCWDPPETPRLARAMASRSGRGSSGRRRKFFVTFEGEDLGRADQTAAMKTTLSASSGTITSVRAFPVKDRKAVRVLFELDPGGEASIELRLVLEADGKPLSETWLYRWTPL